MSLPLPWVDKIFSKMALVYGRDFINRWEGLELSDVKTDWGHELAGFENWPEAIAHALSNLPPDRAPTVLQFRELARKAPKPDRPALPEPAANPERMAAELRKLAPILKKADGPYDHKAWARRIVASHDAGQPVRPISLRFAREALHLEVSNA